MVPETYTLTLPSDAVLDASVTERTAAIARKLSLSNDAAQELLNHLVQETSSYEKTALESNQPGGAEWNKRVQGWEAAALQDPEVGGSPDALKKNVVLAKRVLATYFPESISQFLDTTGYGSHPDLLRALVKIGRASSEATLVMPGSTAPAVPKTIEEIFYPTTT